MLSGLTKRFGLLLLAAAFLFGALSGLGLPPALAAAAPGALAPAMPMAGHAAMTDSACDPAGEHLHHSPSGSAPGSMGDTQQCLLACGLTGSLLADPYRPVVSVFRYGVVFRHPLPVAALPHGQVPEPPLFPPIAV